MPLIDATWLLRPAIYLLLWKREVVYVGQSESGVGARIRDHSKNYVFDQVLVWGCKKRELDNLEGTLIETLKPKYNSAGTNNEPSLRYRNSRLEIEKLEKLIEDAQSIDHAPSAEKIMASLQIEPVSHTQLRTIRPKRRQPSAPVDATESYLGLFDRLPRVKFNSRRQYIEGIEEIE